MNQDILALSSAFGFSFTLAFSLVFTSVEYPRLAKFKPLVVIGASLACYMALCGLSPANTIYGLLAGFSAIGVYSGGKNVTQGLLQE